MTKIYQGNLGSYQTLLTDDGSETLISNHFDEACHSTSGAYEETFYNYVQGCEIIEKSQTNEDLHILEVGFGIGMGPLVTFEALAYIKDLKAKIHFYSLEIDPYLVEWIKEKQKASPKEFPQFSDLVWNKNENSFKCEKRGHSLTVLIGDARARIKDLNKKRFDAIYQDPFSPKKNKTLWTLEWFKEIYPLAKKDAIMSTYSATQSVQKSMIEAGFVAYRRKGFGRKRTCTIASPSEMSCSWPRVELSQKVAALLDE